MKARMLWAAAFAMATLAACGVEDASGAGSLGSEAQGIYQPTHRMYFIAADEVDWDYAPSGRNEITGEPFDDVANVFVQQGDQRIGHVYKKALYREYTDASFKTLKPVDAKWRHLGALGPVIRAVVGDTITVVFRNNTTHPCSIHAHGVFYDKASEGAPYADGTSGTDKLDDGVLPGATYTYEYKVPERAGPASHDVSSVMWMYHSHTDEVADTYSGLIGPMIITSAAMARPDGTPKDVDRELVVMFQVFDENQSWYLQENVDRFAGKPATVKVDDEDFVESNLMHSINGFVFGNLPGLTTKRGERVRWYLMGMGTEVDLHTPHWHGNTVTAMNMRTDVVSLLPASMVVADMVPDNIGVWLFHCHVNDHITAGMMAKYRVDPL